MRLPLLLPLIAAFAVSSAGPQAGTASAQEAGGGGTESPETVLTAPGLTLPATFTGTLPMASGPGQEWHLDLWPDQVAHLRRTDREGAPVGSLGRWHAAPERDAIALRLGSEALVFLEIRGDGDLRFMTPDGAPIESEIDYSLSAGPLDPAEIALPMAGMFRAFADAPLFTECLTGRSYPVAMEAAYPEAERAYLGLGGGGAGAPVLAILEGTLAMRPAMEGPDRIHLVIDSFSRLAPGVDCRRAGTPAGPTDTFWRLLEIGGAPAAGAVEGREPYLILRTGAQPAFNATVGCNMMRGGYTLSGETLDFGLAAMTRMACPPPLDERERALSAALDRAARWQLTANALELFDEAGDRVLLAEAAYLP